MALSECGNSCRYIFTKITIITQITRIILWWSRWFYYSGTSDQCVESGDCGKKKTVQYCESGD